MAPFANKETKVQRGNVMSPRSQLAREGLGLKLRQCLWGLRFTFYITMLSMQCTLLLLPPIGWRLDQNDPRKDSDRA